MILTLCAAEEQQAEVIRFHTNFSVGHYYGEKGVDFWKLHEWQKQFAQNDVLVMTHQILSNMLKSGFITVRPVPSQSAC